MRDYKIKLNAVGVRRWLVKLIKEKLKLAKTEND